jgi:hypothetical protein
MYNRIKKHPSLLLFCIILSTLLTADEFSITDLTYCRTLECRNNIPYYPWEEVTIKNTQENVQQDLKKITIPTFGNLNNLSLTNQYPEQNSIKEQTKNIYRFYINPFVSLYSGQKPIDDVRLYSYTVKLDIGVQYWHFYNNYWHFFTDIRLIPYYTDRNSFQKSSLRFDVKELYWISNGTFDNQINFLIGRKLLKDKRSWYYHTSLDTLGIFNKHDLLTYELYAGTRLNSNIIIDGTSTNQHDLKNIKFLIAHGSYEYYKNNSIQLFSLYEDSSTIQNRKLTWVGFRSEGTLPTVDASLNYWLDIAHVNGDETPDDVKESVNGIGLDLGVKYNFTNLKDSVALSFAHGSGGDNKSYTQPSLTNNRSDYLSKHISFRYYGSFLNPELSNINISSLYFTHKLAYNRDTTAIIALHNYKQDVASTTQYSATNYTVSPNGVDKDLGNELDFIVGQYAQGKYDWRFVLSYFLGGDAFNGVASDKDGIYGQFNFRYYW